VNYFPIIIPCAGKGSRAGLPYPKSLHLYKNKTIFQSIVEKSIAACAELSLEAIFIIIINGYDDDFSEILTASGVKFILVDQSIPLGTADAVYKGVCSVTEKYNQLKNSALIWGDCIGFKVETLKRSIMEISNCDVVIPGYYSNACYTAFQVDENNSVSSCYETKNISHDISAYTDIGIFSFNNNKLKYFLDVEARNSIKSHRESSFIDALSNATNLLNCILLDIADPEEKQGFNSQIDLKK
jgi:bifunctional N-acetylglucosamine-1-phosphate-uridyltransferase/glucosamine-1-phosphate-acetyltransferase GlmU-like protein